MIYEFIIEGILSNGWDRQTKSSFPFESQETKGTVAVGLCHTGLPKRDHFPCFIICIFKLLTQKCEFKWI